jgi:threonine synthase
MSKLKLGKMTGQELAEWFGVKYSTYKNRSSKYIKKLEDYCEYEQVRGGAIIKEIYVEEYDKNLKTNNDKLYIKELT